MQKEALYINRSLSFLEQAILALADRRREHVPFRQSKLTHALKDSLGLFGTNSKIHAKILHTPDRHTHMRICAASHAGFSDVLLY